MDCQRSPGKDSESLTAVEHDTLGTTHLCMLGEHSGASSYRAKASTALSETGDRLLWKLGPISASASRAGNHSLSPLLVYFLVK